MTRFTQPDSPQTLREGLAVNQTATWSWSVREAHLGWPLVELRREHGIEVV